MTALPDAAPLPYRVKRATAESPDSTTIVLESEGTALPRFTPGQFAMVYVFGVGDIPVSVCGIGRRRLSHTVRAVGAVSGALRSLEPGATVGIRGPFGTGWDLTTAAGRDLLIIAGGLGLAPLRPLVREALAAPGRYGRLNVVIGARTPADLLYTDQTPDWRAAGARVLTTVDRPDAAWTGDVGVVTALLSRATFEPGESAAFVCGPEVMMRATARDLTRRGLAGENIRVSLERNMHCGTGHCGHCQLGPLLLCRDGPVVPWSVAQPLLAVREL